MLPILERLKTWWNTADRNQRVVVLGGLATLLLLVVGTAFFVTRPHYEMLYGNLDDGEAGQLVEALKAKGVPYRLGAHTIEVPAEQVQAVRLQLTAEGHAPKGTKHWTSDDLGKISAMTPPGAEKKIQTTILEGEIATTLESMPGVATAQVLVTTPERRAFADHNPEPTASVTIVEDGRGILNAESGRIIADLVSGAVDGLRPAGVVVVSNVMGEVWNGKNGETSGSKADLDAKVAHDWEARLQTGLDLPFGVGNTRVIVRADVDTAKVHREEHESNPASKPREVTTEQETMQNGKPAARGIPGAASNTTDRNQALATPPSDDGKVSGYDKKNKQATYDSNFVDRVIEEGTGGLKGLAVTVIANSDAVKDENKVKEIVKGFLGGLVKVDAQGQPERNQPFSAMVTSVPFDKSATQAAKDAADRQAGGQRTQQILSLLPIAAILVVALLVAKQVGKVAQSVLPAPVAMAPGSLAEEPDAIDSPDGTSALPAPEPEPVDAFAAAAAASLGAPSSVLLEPFKERVDVPLESLRQMALERPEMVANLIKSMMLGERS